MKKNTGLTNEIACRLSDVLDEPVVLFGLHPGGGYPVLLALKAYQFRVLHIFSDPVAISGK